MAGIEDKLVTQSVLACLVQTTKYQTEEEAFISRNELARQEFFEILVRIADAKYIKTNQVEKNNHSLALLHLLNDHFFEILTLKKFPQQQPFRQE